jgi:hypothetical protein
MSTAFVAPLQGQMSKSRPDIFPFAATPLVPMSE